jgi:CRISPR-associated protein Csb1
MKPANFVLPALAEIVDDLRSAIDACTERMAVTEVSFNDELKKGKEQEAGADSGDTADDHPED